MRERKISVYLCVFIAMLFLLSSGASVLAAETPAGKKNKRAQAFMELQNALKQDAELKNQVLTGPRDKALALINQTFDLSKRPRIQNYLMNASDERFAEIVNGLIEAPDLKTFRRQYLRKMTHQEIGRGKGAGNKFNGPRGGVRHSEASDSGDDK